MLHATSRLAVRVAIVAASLAWAGFVFTNTVGDPGRGERVATAVLADDAARAEVVAPIAATVVRTAGMPADRRPAVEAKVDALLQDPDRARTFVDPFAGQWARMLGAEDARPARYDVAPILDEVLGAVPTAAESDVAEPGVAGDIATAGADEVLVSGVPLPQARLDWLVPSRHNLSRATAILALVAVVGFLIGFAIGDPRRVLRRLGVWAASAGAFWVVTPIVLVWAARRWATGADSVIAVAVDEATSGLRTASVALLVGGVLAFAGSWLWVPARADRAVEAAATTPVRARRRVADPYVVGPAPADDAGHASVAGRRRMADLATSATRPVAVVGGAPATAEMPLADLAAEDEAAGADDDPLWSFYAGGTPSRG